MFWFWPDCYRELHSPEGFQLLTFRFVCNTLTQKFPDLKYWTLGLIIVMVTIFLSINTIRAFSYYHRREQNPKVKNEIRSLVFIHILNLKKSPKDVCLIRGSIEIFRWIFWNFSFFMRDQFHARLPRIVFWFCWLYMMVE